MYTTDELVALTGVPTRTLSNYVKEGLVPDSPDGYWHERQFHLLLAINRLRQEKVTRLDDIRARLLAMTPEALAAFVEVEGDAKEDGEEDAAVDARPVAPAAGAGPSVVGLSPAPSAGTWVRHVLGPGVELHVSMDAEPHMKVRAEEILARFRTGRG